MLLSDVEKLLGITVEETQKPTYEARLVAAIDQAKTECGRDFLDDEGKLSIPSGAQMGVAWIVKAMGETPNVSSQSLGDMSKSFFEGATYRAALGFLKPYRKAGFK